MTGHRTDYAGGLRPYTEKLSRLAVEIELSGKDLWGHVALVNDASVLPWKSPGEKYPLTINWMSLSGSALRLIHCDDVAPGDVQVVELSVAKQRDQYCQLT